jgi:hypothetical protein
MKVFTIGFTKTSAESFFTRLQNAGVKKVIDVRLSNQSQLAGFAKKDDLRYFLASLCGIEYLHQPELAPTQEMFDTYKKQMGKWTDLKKQFIELMKSRRIDETIHRESVDGPAFCVARINPIIVTDGWWQST